MLTIRQTTLWTTRQWTSRRLSRWSSYSYDHRFIVQPARSLTTSSNTSSKSGDADDHDDPNKKILYESPLGAVVTRLRAVSLTTGVVGSIGLPLIVMLKGGDLPSTGLLAVGMMFVSGTIGTTIAVHTCFSPYVYRIEQIPIRKCHYKKKDESEASVQQPPADLDKKPCLLKAVSKTLFLTTKETVFDPATDVQKYKGLRPMCNFTAKGVPLYVHPEYLANLDLRNKLHLDDDKDRRNKQVKDNPDDFL